MIEIKNELMKELISRRYPQTIFSMNSPREPFSIYVNSTGFSQSTPLLAQSKEYYNLLQGMNLEELTKLNNEEKEKKRLEYEKQDKYLFFNQLDANADFEYWCKFSGWTLEQAIALSLGKDPKKVNSNSISIYLPHSPFAAEYIRRRELITHEMRSLLIDGKITPDHFITWAKHNNIDISKELEEVISNRQEFVDWRKKYSDLERLHNDLKNANDTNLVSLQQKNSHQNEQINKLTKEKESLIAQIKVYKQEKSATAIKEKPFHPREKETLLKIIAAISVDAYGYDPTSKNKRYLKHQLYM